MERHREVSKQKCSTERKERKERKEKSDDARKKERMSWRLIVEDERGDINDLADAFIKNFHNQLKIQHEESFKRFQDMIARGV
ncbi:hypothetical protein SLEP1_g31711 [Rubroshorea leprosula]|uniref:Uncharacterized protein n=1 Tax=Rubroshorea leprosula TaxID=152421 RepID=A0AAV5K8L3_9ROSI|nr:hypothetical protein SLEP1_g31711 [Rubroshorea leprosula]